MTATTASTPAATMATSSGLLSVPLTSTSKDAFPNVDTNTHEGSNQLDDWIANVTTDDQLNELEERHGKIMRDIRHLENKLDQFLSTRRP